MEKYLRQRILGRGTFAQAWLAQDKATGEKVVLKEIRTQNKAELTDAMTEGLIHAAQKHPNIIMYAIYPSV